ncbi:MAG: hypothetical protein IH851_04225 [Armatimonadetes bacterium]|nr:hypothetical protein [Armatimonadota bacterium]
MKMKTMISVLCVIAFGTATAQVPETGPPAELKELDWMIGEWTGSWNWIMEGMEGPMTDAIKVEWEGQFMKTTSNSEFMGVKMTDVSYLAWDAKQKKLASWTFTNFAPMPRIEWGTITGNTIVFLSEPWTVSETETVVSRATMIKKSDSEMSLLLEFKVGDSWSKVADAVYKKKSA